MLVLSSSDDALPGTSQIVIPSSQSQEMEASFSQIRSLPSLKSRTETEEMIVPSSQSQEALLTPSVALELAERRKLLQAPPKENVESEIDEDIVPTSQTQMENDMTFADALQQRDSLQKMGSLSSLSSLSTLSMSSVSDLDEENVPPPSSGPNSRRAVQDLQRTDSNGSMIIPMSDIDIESLFENGDASITPHPKQDDDTTDDLPPNPSQASSTTESESGAEDRWKYIPPRTAMMSASPSQKKQLQRTVEEDEEVMSPHATYSPSQEMRLRRMSRDDEEHALPHAGYSPSQKRSSDDEEAVSSPSRQTHVPTSPTRESPEPLAHVDRVLQDWPSQVTFSLSEAKDSQYSLPEDAKGLLDF
ncbi:hypothetical protein MPER_07591 [Moniliophthora perniciosa FA553]|nr:hypothetical protein MPER_07591 [Moniliophthora perniciosa FA553]